MKSSRVLTILFTDIADFTAKTSRSSREEFHNYMDKHDQILKPIFLRFNGEIIKTIGDAFLVTFESPTNAVVCSVFIQEKLKEYNDTVPVDARIQVRIAINSGEVEERNGDVFGEPVNIASRIESITEPGEIYFTEAVYLAMNKSEVPTCEVGKKILKGIPEPVKVYKVTHEADFSVSRLRQSYPQYETNYNMPVVELELESTKIKNKKKRSVWFYVGCFILAIVALLIVFKLMLTENHLIISIESNLKAKNNSHHIILAYYDQYGHEEKVIEWQNRELINELYLSFVKDYKTDPLDLKKDLEIKYGRYFWNLKDFEVYLKLAFMFDEKKELRVRVDLLKNAYHLSQGNKEVEGELYRLITEYPTLLSDFISGKVLFNRYRAQNEMVAAAHVETLLDYVLYNDSLFPTNDEQMAFLKKVIDKASILKLLLSEKVALRLLAFDLCEEWLPQEKKIEFYVFNLFSLDDNYLDMQNRSFLFVSGLKDSSEWVAFKKTPFYDSVIKVNGLPLYGDKGLVFKTMLVEMFSPEIVEKAKSEFGKNLDYFDRIAIFELLEIAKELSAEQKWEFHQYSLLKTTMKYSSTSALSKALLYFKNIPADKKSAAIAVLEEGVDSINLKISQYEKEGRANWVNNATFNLKKVKDLIRDLKGE